MHATSSADIEPPAVLEARHLGLERGGRCLCGRLTFTACAGERLEIIGANGTGKTSLLRVLVGLSEVYSGDILWRGRPRREVRERYVRELTYVAHKTGFKSTLSARENLRFYAGLKTTANRRDGVAVRETDDRIGRALDRFGLADLADAPCSALSEGQRRRAVLARLPVERTVIWLLDEPAAMLDRQGVATLEALLTEHAARGGVAVVATHQPLGAADGVRRLELPLGGSPGAPC